MAQLTQNKFWLGRLTKGKPRCTPILKPFGYSDTLVIHNKKVLSTLKSTFLSIFTHLFHATCLFCLLRLAEQQLIHGEINEKLYGTANGRRDVGRQLTADAFADEEGIQVR